VLRTVFLGYWPEPKTDHSSPASGWVTNAWGYATTHQHTILMYTVHTGHCVAVLSLAVHCLLIGPLFFVREWLIRLFVGYWFACNSSAWLDNWLLFIVMSWKVYCLATCTQPRILEVTYEWRNLK
jgi:hypothetical protein